MGRESAVGTFETCRGAGDGPIELKNGNFRFWHETDQAGRSDECPLIGADRNRRLRCESASNLDPLQLSSKSLKQKRNCLFWGVFDRRPNVTPSFFSKIVLVQRVTAASPWVEVGRLFTIEPSADRKPASGFRGSAPPRNSHHAKHIRLKRSPRPRNLILVEQFSVHG